jgi:hypothetical protein
MEKYYFGSIFAATIQNVFVETIGYNLTNTTTTRNRLLERNTLMRYFLAAVLLTICATSANASIIYNVNRTIDAGSVTGFIETDGTLGTLGSANITNWILTITAPNIGGGTPSVIDFATSSASLIGGTAVTATSDQILFDFSPTGAGYMFMAGSDYWCLDTGIATCTGVGVGEHIGFPDYGGNVAQTTTYSSSTVIATVVPVPAAVWLFGSGLACLIGAARRNKA